MASVAFVRWADLFYDANHWIAVRALGLVQQIWRAIVL